MLKKLHDAAKAVLETREGQHSLAQEIEAYEGLAAAVAAAGAELKKAKKAAASKTSTKSSASTKKA